MITTDPIVDFVAVAGLAVYLINLTHSGAVKSEKNIITTEQSNAMPLEQPRRPVPLAIVAGGADSHEVISEHDPHSIIHSAVHRHAFQAVMKDALRTPGMGVRWHDGHIEWGKE